MKHSFLNDYSEGAHPQILEALSATNLQQETGYGLDSVSLEAAKAIQKHLKNDQVDIHFISGGTHANLTVLSAITRPHHSIIAVESGHINVHEAGAIEATGHKINICPAKEGKLTLSELEKTFKYHTDEHMVKPKVVFISQATELGTVYTKQEIAEISQFCHQNGLYLYLDGARLGSALVSENSDLKISDLPQFCDAFYIGGTKNGALLGEAIVICNDELKEDFRYHLKMRGGLLAKGRLLGVQFLELFKEDLFFNLAKHANQQAKKLSDGIEESGYKFLVPSSTNQIFPILPNPLIDKLQKNFGFYKWQEIDSQTSACRLITSWATQDQPIEEFLTEFKNL